MAEATTRVRWGLAVRLLARDWKAGETLVLLIALLVAVAAMLFLPGLDRHATGVSNFPRAKKLRRLATTRSLIAFRVSCVPLAT